MTAARPRHLRPVPSPRPKRRGGKCQIGAHVVLAGAQETRVEAAAALAGPNPGYIAIRIGNLAVWVQDWPALQSLMAACTQAADLAPEIFPVLGVDGE